MTLSQRALASRAGAVAILALLLAALWLGPVEAYRGWLADRAGTLATQQQLLVRYRALAGPGAGLAPTPAAAGLLLPAQSDAQAAALLQELLKRAATDAAVEVEALQVLQPEPVPGSSRIGVRLRARGAIGGLDRLIYAIEASRPLLLPDNLQIQARPLQPASAAPVLEFQLDIAAFRSAPA